MSKRENPHLNCKMQNRGVFGLTSTTAFCIIRGVKKSKEKFFGRDSELAQLEGLWSKDTASLVTCRGRRLRATATRTAPSASRGPTT